MVGRRWGAGLPEEVTEIALYPDGSLFAAVKGSLKLYYWDKTQWTENGVPEKGSIRSLLAAPDGAVLIGGYFTRLAGILTPYLARFQDGQWQAYTRSSTTVNSSIRDLAWIGGKLYVAGAFSAAGDQYSTGIVTWDGAHWTGLAGGGVNSYVSSIEPDGQDGFYVGGSFNGAGSIPLPANAIAHWTGTAWQTLGSGLERGMRRVEDLATGPDGSLYAGGYFETAGGGAANRVARWDGANWSGLNSGFNDFGEVLTIAIDPSGTLYVGGDFTTAGAPGTAYIARWDGTAWSALGTGVNGTVRGMVYSPDDHSLYVSGKFTQVGGQATAPVARWSIDEQAWYPTQSADMVISTYDAHTLSLGPQNQVIFGGTRKLPDGSFVDDLAWYDGLTWQWLGAQFGMGSSLAPVVFTPAGDFYVAGSFFTVDNQTSPFLAHWVPTLPAGQGLALTGQEDTALALHAQDFVSHFLPAGQLAEVRFSQLSADGALSLNGQPVTVGQTIPTAELDRLTFTPAQDFTGAAHLHWVGLEAERHVSRDAALDLTFAPVNDPPQAGADQIEVREDTPLTFDVLVNDTDVDGPQLQVDALGSAQHGQVTLQPDGRLRYTPDPDYAGPDSFTYTVSDGFSPPASAAAQVTIQVAAVNDSPRAVDDVVSAVGAQPVTIWAAANDTDVDSVVLTITAVEPPQHGTAVIDGDGSIRYTPAAEFDGTDEFTYTVSDGAGGTAQGKVRVVHQPRFWIYIPVLCQQ